MTFIHPSWKTKKPDGQAGTPKPRGSSTRTKLAEKRKKEFTFDQLKNLYDRLGSIQGVVNATRLNYKHIAKLFDDAGIKRKSGWQRQSWTIKPERRTRYGQDAEDEGGERGDKGIESLHTLLGEEVE